MDLSKLFWDASADEIARGFVHDPAAKRFICLVCGAEFAQGVVYPFGDILCDAGLAVKQHIVEAHSSMFEYLIEVSSKYSGLTDLQRQLLSLFYSGLSDDEVAKQLQVGSTSTIRNHRFKLREKEKHAKIFLALMRLLSERPRAADELASVHRRVTMVDERFAITEPEKEKLIGKYFENNGEGALLEWPSREKRKVVVVQQLAKRFEAGRRYTEKEVNEVLQAAYHDYVTLRRYLIEYGFMDRTRDGSAYWVNL